VVIAVGAQKPMSIPVPGNQRLIPALDFLIKAKQDAIAPGKNVVIIGAGNVGCDAATEAARLLYYRALYMLDKGLKPFRESSIAKCYATDMAIGVTSKAIEIHGSTGVSADYPLERYFRDAKILEIYEGTSEMQRLTIARELLKGS